MIVSSFLGILCPTLDMFTNQEQQFLQCTVTGDGTWVNYATVKTIRASLTL
jgi:hypothetical protein